MDILAARDQENQVHHLHAGTAGKSGMKAVGAKTPANKAPKTPFKVPLNDENAVSMRGKSVLKTNGKANLPMTVKKNGKHETNAFVTPAGPRSRAPLGMKTTNAKATAFQTPAAASSTKTQKASPRLRRPKVKVHQPEQENNEQDDVPEIEYMPPKEVPLPDDMDDYLPSDLKYPMFEGKNATRGMWEVYHNPVEEDGRTRGQREFEDGIERDRKKRDEEFDKLFNAQWEKDQEETSKYFGVEPLKKAVPQPSIKPGDPKKKISSGPSTIKARSAVAALSETSKPNFAASRAANKSHTATDLNPVKKNPKSVIVPSNSRHAAATAASKTTISYAKGRATTNVAPRKPLSNVTKPAPFSAATRRPASTTTTAGNVRAPGSSATASTGPRLRGAFSRSSSTSTQATLVAPQEQEERTTEDVEREMERLFLQDSDGEDADAWASSFASQLDGVDPFDEDLEGFQMQLPEGLQCEQ